jgi:hypothetical protein
MHKAAKGDNGITPVVPFGALKAQFIDQPRLSVFHIKGVENFR